MTDRRPPRKTNARAELAHSSRLALVGELTASITHEISQPLTAVHSNAGAGLQILDRGAGSDRIAMLRDILSDIYTNSDLVRDVIERLRALSRKQSIELGELDVNEVLGDLVKLVGGEAQLRGITLQSEFGRALPRVNADRVCLRQVVLNLIVNAMDAVNQADRERVVVLKTRRRRDGVEISVTDTDRESLRSICRSSSPRSSRPRRRASGWAWPSPGRSSKPRAVSSRWRTIRTTARRSE